MKAKTKNTKIHQMLTVCCLFASLSSAAEKTADSDIAGSDNTRQIAQQIWQSTIGAPARQDAEPHSKLQQLIAQIRSVRFESKSSKTEPVIGQMAPAGEPNETASAAIAPPQPAATKMESKPDRSSPYEPITEQSLQMLEKLSQHPEQPRKPLELAEILFVSCQLKQAATFYQQALDRQDPNDPSSAEDRAWILLQISNCLRADDLPSARSTYSKLITAYPNSLWADVAKALERLIDWYQSDKPRALIEECRSDLLNSAANTSQQ
jgi:tetratricopeptide (TPR) repeat protein